MSKNTPHPYQHGINRLLFASDCLKVLRDNVVIEPGSIDLIYLDPPFNSKANYNLPFKQTDSSAKPIAAFTDTWQWGPQQDETLAQFADGPMTESIADLIEIARRVEGISSKYRLDAYLVNMAERLIAMKNVLKPTGSIYLHCDPTASHYLKVLMDLIFGENNFKNEILWCYTGPSNTKRWFPQKHDTILFYTKGTDWTFNADAVRVPYKNLNTQHPTKGGGGIGGNLTHENVDEYRERGKIPENWWSEFSPVGRIASERLGYPTQKPLQLLERIIKASSNEGDLVLDPFCGCGTTLHAAESLDRRWIGIDIARFSAGLVRNRLLSNFSELSNADIQTRGIPETVAQARKLADDDKFEFEKWACGHVGAEGMFHEPGTRGADGGVDGVVKFYPLYENVKVVPHYAVVQVKGGKVTPDSVKALNETRKTFGMTAGIMICFNDQMGTVENQRSKEIFTDATAEHHQYPVIQGLSVEDMLKGKKPYLPNLSKMVDGDKYVGRGKLSEPGLDFGES